MKFINQINEFTMESEDGTWESMERSIGHESMWKPGVGREEVRAAQEMLYRTGDPSCLDPFIRMTKIQNEILML